MRQVGAGMAGKGAGAACRVPSGSQAEIHPDRPLLAKSPDTLGLGCSQLTFPQSPSRWGCVFALAPCCTWEWTFILRCLSVPGVGRGQRAWDLFINECLV